MALSSEQYSPNYLIGVGTKGGKGSLLREVAAGVPICLDLCGLSIPGWGVCQYTCADLFGKTRVHMTCAVKQLGAGCACAVSLLNAIHV